MSSPWLSWWAGFRPAHSAGFPTGRECQQQTVPFLSLYLERRGLPEPLGQPSHPSCVLPALNLEAEMSRGNPTGFRLDRCGCPTSSFCGMVEPGLVWFEFRSILVSKCPFKAVICCCLPRTVASVCYQLLPPHWNKMLSKQG